MISLTQADRIAVLAFYVGPTTSSGFISQEDCQAAARTGVIEDAKLGNPIWFRITHLGRRVADELIRLGLVERRPTGETYNGHPTFALWVIDRERFEAETLNVWPEGK